MKKFAVMIVAILLALGIIGGTQIGIWWEGTRMDEALAYQENVEEKIAVVNEDLGATNDGEEKNYASAIIETLDDTFVLVSKQAAESGLETGSYAAVVTFPSDLSKNLVSVNTLYPEEVTITYQVNQDLPEQQYLDTYTKLMNMEYDITRNFSYMYVDALYEEFHSAQNEVQTVLQNDADDLAAVQKLQLNDFRNNIRFEELPANTMETERADVAEALQQVQDNGVLISNDYLESYQMAQMDYNEVQQRLQELIKPAGIVKDKVMVDPNAGAGTTKPETPTEEAPAEETPDAEKPEEKPGWSIDMSGGLMGGGGIQVEVPQTGENAGVENSTVFDTPGSSLELPVFDVNQIMLPYDPMPAEEAPDEGGEENEDGLVWNGQIDYMIKEQEKPLSYEELQKLMIDMMKMVEGYKPSGYLDQQTVRTVQQRISEINTVINEAESQLNEVQSKNLENISQTRQNYNEYITTMRQAATETHEADLEQLNTAVKEFVNTKTATSQENQNLLGDFAAKLPYSKKEEATNQNTVEFTSSPVKYTDVTSRETPTVTQEGRNRMQDTLWKATAACCVLLLLVLIAMLVSIAKRARKAKRMDDED